MSEFIVTRSFERRFPHLVDELSKCSTWSNDHRDELVRLQEHLNRAEGRADELEKVLNTPRTDEFFESVRIEAGHQIVRWGSAHDEGKNPTDWFWLLGYLAGKAVSLPEKRLHHIISSAATLLNWFRKETGDDSQFRPGIASPDARVVTGKPGETTLS